MSKSKGTRAAIYARISRDQQGQGLGVERQEQLCRELAKSLGLDVGEVYTDNDISAYSGRHRPAYERMLTDIEAGRIDAVLCYHSDRLMRRTRELERYIDICRPRGVVTHQVTAGLLDLSSATGLAVAKTVAAWSQHESDHKGERIAAQKAQAAAKGKFLGGRVPWGWQKTAAGIEVEPTAAKHILDGTLAIIAGKSLIGVTRAWAAAGAVSLSGTPMNTTQVRRVLLRPRNAGLMTFHGEVVADSWPAIVPLETFRQCEAVLTSPERPQQSEAKFKYLLSGIAQCYCGRYMTGFGAEGHRRSYRCKVHQEGGKYVPGHANRAMTNLDDYVLRMAAAWLDRPDYKAAVMAEAQLLADKEAPAESADMAELIARKNSLARMFAQGLISESQLIEGSREIEQKLDAIKQTAAANIGSRVMANFAFAENAGELFLQAGIEMQRELLRSAFSITLKPSGPFRGEFDPATVDMFPLHMN
ncbi:MULTISPECIES: recombinase family protein [unclassified Arthrobacter]|uniref:recombinase family protein n=1 Tax=unclassified Arthrobacter TaxID=235627 RepID=UPI001C85E8E1|nr:recombinase family protein [Arthrobacter sp. MAHUQ-56]MBX7444686.1 recombinase family protein [Arthrobacter sp. MAHUQ-56]